MVSNQSLASKGPIHTVKPLVHVHAAVKKVLPSIYDDYSHEELQRRYQEPVERLGD